MEDIFDFQIDFDSLGTTPEIQHQTPEHEEDDLFDKVTHGSRKSFRCKYTGCGKVFKFKSEITRHVIVHQNDRPYPCTHTGCNKSFKRADALENHMRIHAGVLPYRCEIANCDRKFATKAALRYHQIRHDNNRVFRCEIECCRKTFLTSSQLKQHQKAYNFHQNYPAIKIEEQEVMTKKQWKSGDLCETQSSESIQWEMKDQNNEDLEKFESIMKYIIYENKVLKQKLQECEKHKEISDTNKSGFLFNTEVHFSQPAESSSFFDDNELKFLEFLRGHEDSSF